MKTSSTSRLAAVDAGLFTSTISNGTSCGCASPLRRLSNSASSGTWSGGGSALDTGDGRLAVRSRLPDLSPWADSGVGGLDANFSSGHCETTGSLLTDREESSDKVGENMAGSRLFSLGVWGCIISGTFFFPMPWFFSLRLCRCGERQEVNRSSKPLLLFCG